MNKYTLGIDGMGCGMCEAHVQDIIRKNLKVKKVKASHSKNQVIIITENNISIDEFKDIFDSTGYRVTSFNRAIAVKKLLWWK